MANLKKQMKKIAKEQERLNDLINLQQATCPHVSKKGKTWLKEFTEHGILKGRCKKCNEVVILQPEYISSDAVQTAVETIKTTLAELNTRVQMGDVKLDDSTMRTVATFNAEVLRDLPGMMEKFNRDVVPSGKKKKNKKKGKKKENKRRRWTM